MKKSILLSSLLASFLFANEGNFIEIGGGYMNSKDNFSKDSQSTITSSKAKEEGKAIPYIEFFYGHQFNEQTNIYLASQMGELALGTELETNIGYFDIGLTSKLGEKEWENPFLQNTKRKETDVKETGVYLAYGLAFSQNSQSSIAYSYKKRDYDKETLAKELQREGKIHNISLENLIFSKVANLNLAYIANFDYEIYDAKGEASSYKSYGTQLGFSTSLSANTELLALVSLAQKKYDKSNPIYNKTVDASKYGIFTELKIKNFTQNKNIYATLKAGYEKKDANVDFYDKENTFGVISVGYKF